MPTSLRLAGVNLKGHKERSKFMVHFKLQSVLFIFLIKIPVALIDPQI
jgi:hypothetical protein